MSEYILLENLDLILTMCVLVVISALLNLFRG